MSIVPDGYSQDAIRRCFQRLQTQLGSVDLVALEARVTAIEALNIDARLTAIEDFLLPLVLVNDDGTTVLNDDGDPMFVFG